MAFFALLWKARSIEKYKLNYEKEKINSIVTGHAKIEPTLTQRWRHYRYDTQKRISGIFKKWYPEGSGVANFFLYLRTDQTFPNFLLKSLMGFVGGIILTYMCFMFFVFQLSISLIHSTIMSSIIGVLLTLGLAFSYRIRCLVFLLIPQFFSRVGRYTLTCYALVLILTGPATNTLKNSELLSESMACSQEQIKTSVHHLNELAKKPYTSMKESIQLMIDKFKAIAMRAQQIVVKMNRLVFSIVGIVQYSFAWLQSVSNTCNTRLGTPYDRCTQLLQDGIVDSKKNSGLDMEMPWNVAYLVQAVCGAVKPITSFCKVTDFMDEAILANIRRNIKEFTAKIRALFHVKVHIRKSYSFISNSSRSASQVAAGIVTELRYRTGPLLTWLSWSSCVTSLFLLLIIFRAKYYQHMYETRSRFDNRYITKELQELDLQRQRQGRETVLPLNRRERAKYITTSSFRLVASEKTYLTRSAVFMLITTFKLLIHIVADYSLYWVLMTIRYHGQYLSNLKPGVPHTGAHVTGSGFVARLLRSIVDTFSIPLARPAPSLIPCLPDPYPPDFRRYTQIGVLIFLLWFFALFEPYGLRLRHLIMGQYRPERAKARATWLYNHILRTRAGFMKFARRKLHRKYKYSTENLNTFRSWLHDLIPFQCLRYVLGVGPREPHCLLCGTTTSCNDSDTQLTKCDTSQCPGVYCTTCFTDIGQLCTICLSPNDYGDLSDVSLERGSSEDDDDDSGSEFCGNVQEHTKLLEAYNSNELPNTQRSSRRWNYFMASVQPTMENDFLREYYKNIRQNRDCRQENKEIAHIKYVNTNKYQNRDKDKTNDEKYTISKDYNNNIVLEVPKLTVVPATASIGTNTEKHDLFTSVKSGFIKKITTHKSRRLIKRPRKRLPLKVDNILHLRINIKRTDSICNKVNICQRDCKYVDKHKIYHNNITIWKQIKAIIQIIRLLKQCHNDYNNTNKNNNKFKQNKSNKVSKDSKTPKKNKTNKNTKDTKRRSKDIEKDVGKRNRDRNKNVKDVNKVNKLKEKSDKTPRNWIAKEFNSFWRNVKSNMGFHTNRPIDTSSGKNKKNHKRRKKRKVRDNEQKNKDKKGNKEIKSTRNYRLSAFFADYDWMKRDYNKPVITGNESSDSCHVTRAYSCRALPPARLRNKVVAMVQVDPKPFQKRQVDDKVQRAPAAKVQCKKSKSESLLRNTSIKALERFQRRINKSAEQSLAPSLVCLNIDYNSSINSDDSSICLTKRESCYHNFKNEVLKLDEIGMLGTGGLLSNERYSDFLQTLDFEPKVSMTNIIDKKRSLYTPSDINRVVSDDTELAKEDSLLSYRFEKFERDLHMYEVYLPKNIADSFKYNVQKYENNVDCCKEICKDSVESCTDKIVHSKKTLNKYKQKVNPIKVHSKTPSEKICEAAGTIKKMCTILLAPAPACDDRTCRYKQRRGRHLLKVQNKVIPVFSMESVLDNIKSALAKRCKCCSLDDIQRKWTHIKESGCCEIPRLSLKERVKKYYSTLVGSCNENTCSKLSRQQYLQEVQKPEFEVFEPQIEKEIKPIKLELNVCRKEESREWSEIIEACSRGAILIKVKPLDFKKCADRNEANLKEIQRHIDREKKLERQIEIENKRHLENNLQIEKELSDELIQHIYQQKKLICGEDVKNKDKCALKKTKAPKPKKAKKQKTTNPDERCCPCVISTSQPSDKSAKRKKQKGNEKIADIPWESQIPSKVMTCQPQKVEVSCDCDMEGQRRLANTVCTGVGSQCCTCNNIKVGRSTTRTTTCSCATQCPHNPNPKDQVATMPPPIAAKICSPRPRSGLSLKIAPKPVKPCEKKTSPACSQPSLLGPFRNFLKRFISPPCAQQVQSPRKERYPRVQEPPTCLEQFSKLPSSPERAISPCKKKTLDCEKKKSPVRIMSHCCLPYLSSSSYYLISTQNTVELVTSPKLSIMQHVVQFPENERCPSHESIFDEKISTYKTISKRWLLSSLLSIQKRMKQWRSIMKSPLVSKRLKSRLRSSITLRSGTSQRSPSVHSISTLQTSWSLQGSPLCTSSSHNMITQKPVAGVCSSGTCLQNTDFNDAKFDCQTQCCLNCPPEPMQCVSQIQNIVQQKPSKPKHSPSTGWGPRIVPEEQGIEQVTGEVRTRIVCPPDYHPSDLNWSGLPLPNQWTFTEHSDQQTSGHQMICEQYSSLSKLPPNFLADMQIRKVHSRPQYRSMGQQMSVSPTVSGEHPLLIMTSTSVTCDMLTPLEDHKILRGTALNENSQHHRRIPIELRDSLSDQYNRHTTDLVQRSPEVNQRLMINRRGGRGSSDQYTLFLSSDNTQSFTNMKRYHATVKVLYRKDSRQPNSVTARGNSYLKQQQLSLESSLYDNDQNSLIDTESYIDHSSQTDVENSDTTVYSMATVQLGLTRKHRRVKIAGQQNQGTSTENPRVCDTGTLTTWWNPVVKRKGRLTLEKKQGNNKIEDSRREFGDFRRKRISFGQDGRVVKFQSGAQIIPSTWQDLNLMTPSRYLLESQRYYNELFAYNAKPQTVELPQWQDYTQKVYDKDKGWSPIGSRRAYNRKAKRTESPKKMVCGTKKRHTDSTRAVSPRIKTSIYRKSVKRYCIKINAGTNLAC